MSQSPLSYQPTQIRPASPNILGIVGFSFAMVGLLGFCFAPALLAGLVGAVLCGIGLFWRPRGFAIAGLCVSVIEIVVGGFMAIVVGVIFASGVRTAAQNAKTAVSASHAATVSFAIDAYHRQNGKLPTSLNDLPPFGTNAADGFGRPIRYVPSADGQSYKLMSDSWDEKPNTPDDSTLTDTSVKQMSMTKIPTISRTPETDFDRANRQQAIASYDVMIESLKAEIAEKKQANTTATELVELDGRLQNLTDVRAKLIARGSPTTVPAK